MQLNHDKKTRWIIVFVMLLALTGIYLGLYHNFIFGDQMYTYEDVGKDTSEQCLPSMVFAANSMKEEFGTGYHLNFGFGKYCENMNFKMLRLENIPYLVFGEGQLHIAVMVSLYLKYVAICLVAFLFFRRLLHNDWTSAVCALLWTFCGYLVLWGQNYPFLAAMLAFTIAMYGFQLYLESDPWQILVVPAVALLALTNYYHLYIVTFYFLVYGVLYLSFCKKKPIEILKKAGIFAVAMVAAVAIAGTYILPAIANFFDSTRINQVKSSMDFSGIFYDFYIIASFAARFFSTNLIGVGNNFAGPTNYYECAILSVSLLFVFAFIYAMQTKLWKKFLPLTLASLILLCMPKVSQVLNFASNTQRWTFLLCFSQIIGIGFVITQIFTDWKKPDCSRKLFISLIASDILIGAIMLAGQLFNRSVGGWFINKTAMTLLFVILALYNSCALVMWFIKKPIIPFVVAVSLELILGNYLTVNDRDTVSVQEWYQDNFYDGTKELVDDLKNVDESVYRISKTYQSVGNMDPLMQGYNGPSVYFSTNPASLVQLAKSYGYGTVGNWIRFEGNDLLSNTMMGVRYVITEKETPMNPMFYRLLHRDDVHAVYENIYYLGMGYLYDSAMETKSLPETTLEKLLHLSTGYYLESEDEPVATSESADSVILPVSYNVRMEGENAILSLDLPKMEDTWLLSGVRIRVSNQQEGMACLKGTYGDMETLVLDRKDLTTEDRQYVLNYRDTVPVDHLELELTGNVQIEAVELIMVDGTALCDHLSRLQQGAITDMVQKKNTFTGSVENTSEEDMKLCIPLIYEPYWRATVDGNAVEVQNINGGLTGLSVGPGVHEISVTYHNPYVTAGNILTVVSLVGYGIFVWIHFKKISFK